MGDADRAEVDDEVAYAYDIHNNGTTTMSGIELSDGNVRTLSQCTGIVWRLMGI